MPSKTPVGFDELLSAFEFANAGYQFENSAFISLETGSIHWKSALLDEQEALPEDLEDASRYIAVPHKNELDLGRNLALSFAEEVLPDDYETIEGFFFRRGAYRRFKDFLDEAGKLEAWYEYEANAVKRALREWCEENEIQIKP